MFSLNDFEDAAKLPYGNWLGVLDGQVKIADAPALALNRNLRQRNDCRDAMGIAIREFFGVGNATNKEALPNSRHSAPSSSMGGSFRRFIPTFLAIQAGISGRFSCLATMLRPVSQSISAYWARKDLHQYKAMFVFGEKAQSLASSHQFASGLEDNADAEVTGVALDFDAEEVGNGRIFSTQ